MSNYFKQLIQQDVAEHLSLKQLQLIDDSEFIFAQLQTLYPVTDSRIDWQVLVIKEQEVAPAHEQQLNEFLSFFRWIVKKYGLTGNMYWAGDSAVDFAISGDIGVFDSVLDKLLDIPQYHYLVADDFAWCFCFSFEGDMGFGYCPEEKI